ncbi:Intraflagellar transport protein 88 -like protein [Halotydeus destructor]|nr:Intraflagellar transport protein 88 -like protein [Halotydeus destructor]
METSQTTAANSDEDLYSGYNEFNAVLDSKAVFNDEGFQQAALKSSYGRRGLSTGMRPTGPSRMGTAGYQRGAFGGTPTTSRRMSSVSGVPPATGRPMTAVRGAGYTSINNRSPTSFDPLNQAKNMSNFQGRDDSTPEAKIRNLELKVNSLLEESVANAHRTHFSLALEKAKEAVAKERSLARQKEQNSSTNSNVDSVSASFELAITVQFNLAIQFANNEMFSEAINTYTNVIKNKSFSNTGRLRTNIGDLYYRQGNYAKAIKFFRMALDQVPNMQKDVRMKIMQNIGLCFVKMNLFADAITSFEYIMSEKADYRTALSLIVCHYALGDRENMRKWFPKLLENQDSNQLSRFSEPLIEDEDDPMYAMVAEVTRSDQLAKIDRNRKHERDWCILTAAKLISPVIGDTFSQGYEWCVEQIRTSGHSELANDLEINKAVKHLKKREFKRAIETLQNFEKKDTKAASTAATNLSFLYLVQNELVQADKYADDAISADRFNCGALVNKGNCCYKKGDYERAKEYYKEALTNESTCVEALYNLTLSCKKLGLLEQGLDYVYRLHSLVRNHSHVLYQIASLHELLNDRDQAIDWYQQLLNFVPSDPSLLNKLSDIADSERDKQQAFSYLAESYRYFPSHIATIERLAAHYIESQVYEKAIRYLLRASAVQPTEIKWQLMIAACHRRNGNYQHALQYYKRIHETFPDNMECLKFLVRICNDLSMAEGVDFSEKLKKLEKAKELNNQRRENLRSASRTSNRRSASSREGSASSNSSGYVTEHSRSSSKLGSKRKTIYDAGDNGKMAADSVLTDDVESHNERPKTSWKRNVNTEDDFADDDIDDILPE